MTHNVEFSSLYKYGVSKIAMRFLIIFQGRYIPYYMIPYIIQMYSGITRGRVLNGELNLCTKISEVNLTAAAYIYRLFHDDFSSIVRTSTVLTIPTVQNCSLYVPMIEEKSS